VVFRKDTKVDAFQRQLSALRHQLGGEEDHFHSAELDRPHAAREEVHYRQGLPDLDAAPSRPLSMPPDRVTSLMIDQAPPLPDIPAYDAHTSVIAHTTSWNGNLESSGSLHIHGRVDGTLVARDVVFIAEEAEVDATISATAVTVAGNVRGSIRCADRFEVLPRGRVSGDVNAPVIVVHEGAMIAGEISMTGSPASQPAAHPTRAARGGD
jgi:cytoskeletal protein CcmA (bactofilin family)